MPPTSSRDRPASPTGGCKSVGCWIPRQESSKSRLRGCRAFYDVDLNGGRLVHTQHLIGIEVGLLDTAALQRDLAVKRGGGAKDDTALELRLHRVGIDHGAAIHRADHTANADGAFFRDFDLSYLCQPAAECELQRDAAAASLGQSLPPAG